MESRLKIAVMLVLLVLSVLVNLDLLVPSVRAWTPLPPDISQDTTLTLADSPYRAISDVTVQSGVRLTIEPGVEVQFADGFSLVIEGSLSALGTSLNPILFTSSRATIEPSDPFAGAWNKIHLKGNSSQKYLLEHVKVEYAIHGVMVESLGIVAIEKSRILNCSETGVMLIGKSNMVIKESIITQNRNGIGSDDTDTHTGIKIINNTISENQENGIYLYSSGPDDVFICNMTIWNNTVSSNGNNGIYLQGWSGSSDSSYFYDIVFVDNEVSSNGKKGVYLYGYHYISMYNIDIFNNNILYNGDNALQLYGYYYANSHIYDVSLSNNTISYNDGQGIMLSGYRGGGYIHDSTIANNTILYNDAKGIYLSSHGRTDIYNVTISRNTVSFNDETGIRLESDRNIYNVSALNNIMISNNVGLYVKSWHHMGTVFDLLIIENIISANSWGFEGGGSAITNFTGNSVSYNTYGVYYAKTTDNLAYYNDICYNSYGMNVTGGATVNAKYNYWGAATGPYHASINPEGEGNPVNGDGIDLDFWPPLVSPVGTINERPEAKLAVDKDLVAMNEIVTFDASSSSDDGRIDYFFFNFGDETSSAGTTLSVIKHKYTSEGVFNASLIVMDDFGVKSTNPANVTITVAEELTQLTVSLTINQTSTISEDQVSIIAHVTNGTDVVEDANVEFVSDSGGTFSTPSGSTDSNGDFEASFTAPTASEQTNVRITATASKSDYADGSDYKYLSVLPSGAVSLSATVTTDPTTVQPGQTSTITVQVTDGTYLISDASVALSSDDGGTLSPVSGYTNSSGYFVSTFTAPSVTGQTTITITAVASKTGYLDGQGQAQISVATTILSVSVSANPSTVQSGETSTITAQVTHNGNSVSGVTVTVLSNRGGTFTQSSGTTNSNGYFTTAFATPTANTQTTVTITAEATKTGYLDGQDQTNITVNPSQPPPPEDGTPVWIYLIILIVILSIIGGGIAITRRRGHRPKETANL